MAIQTRGFGVDVMPRLAVPTVGFDINAVNTGINQSLDLAASLEKLRAFRAAEAEKSATRQKRIDAANTTSDLATAEGQKGIRMLPSKESLEMAKLEAEREITPLKRKFDIAKLEGDAGNLPILQEAQREAAKAAIADAGVKQRTSPMQEDTLRSELAQRAMESRNAVTLGQQKLELDKAKMDAAKQVADMAIQMTPLEGKLQLAEIQDKLANAKTDQELKRAMQEAELALKKSQTEENLAQADYALGFGRQAAGRPVNPIDQINKAETALKKLDGLTTSDGRMLSKYIADTRESDGSVKKIGTIKGALTPGVSGGDQVKLDQLGEFYIKQRNALIDELRGLQKGATAPAAQSAPAPTAQDATPPTLKGPRIKLENGKVVKVN